MFPRPVINKEYHSKTVTSRVHLHQWCKAVWVSLFATACNNPVSAENFIVRYVLKRSAHSTFGLNQPTIMDIYKHALTSIQSAQLA